MLGFYQLTESFNVISNQLSARPQAIPDSSKMTAHVQIVSSMNFLCSFPSEMKVISIVVFFQNSYILPFHVYGGSFYL